VQENIISWNLANWVSVILMALIGFFLLGTVVSFVKGKRAAQSAVTPNQSPQQSA
jgi:FlaG/FlaF family flagellin (archaellin)